MKIEYKVISELIEEKSRALDIGCGDGNLINGSYASLPWGNAAFMTVSMNGVEVGTTELMAVPYAIASGDKQWVVNGSDIENKNEGEVAIQNNLRVKGGFNLSTGNQVNEISDNGTLSENSNGILPTQRAVKTYVDNRFFAGGGVEQNAGEVPYDNTVSGLTAVNAQDAIDELASAGEGADADADPTNELQNFRFNTAIAALMAFRNVLKAEGETAGSEIWNECLEGMLLMLAPIAPHITEELWQKFKPESGSIHTQSWPAFDEELAAEDLITLVVQVNGKVRDRLEIQAGTSKEETEQIASAAPKVQSFLEGKQISKVIVVPDRLVNIVCE